MATKIIYDDKIYVEQMKIYVENLKEQAKKSKTEATKDAIKALKETGVINEDGTQKTKIVSWG